MFAAKYGDVSLLVTRHSDDGDGRDWVVSSPSSGSQHALQDRGLRQRRTDCSLVFCDEPGVGAYLDRFLAFRELARSSTPRLFVHPLHGAYQAAVTEVTYTVDAQERAVRVDCSFVAMEEPTPVLDVGPGVSAAAGLEDVEAHAAAADEALADIGETSTTPTSCVEKVSEWQDAEIPDARVIAVEAAALAADIDDAIEASQLLTDLSRWTAYRRMVELRYAVTRSATAVTSEVTRLTELTLEVAEPLLSLCARVYGARDAEERAGQVRKLNGLRTPGMVPAGTTIKMPVVDE